MPLLTPSPSGILTAILLALGLLLLELGPGMLQIDGRGAP